MLKDLVICIARQFGSGGREIGKLVSEKLDIPFYDKELINEMSKKSGISKELLEDYDEKPTNSFLYSLSLGAYSYGNSLTGIPEMPLSDKIFVIQSDTIKSIANKGACVIVGRCAETVLADGYNTLSVFVHCDYDKRINRIASLQNISHDEASNMIRKTDKKRATYHNYYSEIRWGDAAGYDLCINSRYGIEKTAEIIKQAALLR